MLAGPGLKTRSARVGDCLHPPAAGSRYLAASVQSPSALAWISTDTISLTRQRRFSRGDAADVVLHGQP